MLFPHLVSLVFQCYFISDKTGGTVKKKITSRSQLLVTLQKNNIGANKILSRFRSNLTWGRVVGFKVEFQVQVQIHRQHSVGMGNVRAREVLQCGK